MPIFQEGFIDGVFIISLATLFVSVITVGIKYCLRSKCEDLNLCWGCVKVKRNVEAEVEEEIARMEHGEVKDNDEIPSPKIELPSKTK